MILDNYVQFIDIIFQKLQENKIDVAAFEMDHIGYQASSDENYDKLKSEFEKLGHRVSENIVGGRRVGIYKLNNPLKYKQYIISAAEVVAPKKDQVCPSALEHVEFVINSSFETFLKKYQNIPWDLTALNQPVFPMVKLKLDKYIQVKFHLTSVLDIIESEKNK